MFVEEGWLVILLLLLLFGGIWGGAVHNGRIYLLVIDILDHSEAFLLVKREHVKDSARQEDACVSIFRVFTEGNISSDPPKSDF